MIATWLAAENSGDKATPTQGYFWTILLLIAALALAAGVVIWIGRWARRTNTETASAGDELSHFRSLYERGELGREEYERIRARLGQRLRQELDLPAPGTEARPAPEAASPGSASGSPPADDERQPPAGGDAGR